MVTQSTAPPWPHLSCRQCEAAPHQSCLPSHGPELRDPEEPPQQRTFLTRQQDGGLCSYPEQILAMKTVSLSHSIYICCSVHIFSLHNERVDNSNMTLGGGGVDAASSTFIGHKQGYPFLKQNLRGIELTYNIPVITNVTMAVSGCPFKAAMCIKVLPSFVRSKTEALNLSAKFNISIQFICLGRHVIDGAPAKNSTVDVCPFSAAKCIGVLHEICLMIV